MNKITILLTFTALAVLCSGARAQTETDLDRALKRERPELSQPDTNGFKFERTPPNSRPAKPRAGQSEPIFHGARRSAERFDPCAGLEGLKMKYCRQTEASNPGWNVRGCRASKASWEFCRLALADYGGAPVDIVFVELEYSAETECGWRYVGYLEDPRGRVIRKDIDVGHFCRPKMM